MHASIPARSLIEAFADALKERIANVGTVNCEDTVRYTFFHTLLAQGYEHWQVELEWPLPTYKGRKLDLLVTATKGLPSLAAEFKYHREKGSSLPGPQLAGGIFSDLSRLGVAHHAFGGHCYLVYVSDSSMTDYLSKPRHGCADFANAVVGSVLEFGPNRLGGRAKTYVRATNGFMEPGTARCVYSDVVGSGLTLKVFAVEHTPDGLYDYA